MRQFLLAILLASSAHAGGDDGFTSSVDRGAPGSLGGGGFSGPTTDRNGNLTGSWGGLVDGMVKAAGTLVNGARNGALGPEYTDMTSGIGGRTVEQMLADKQAREAPRPAPKPTPMPTLYDPPAAPEPSPPAPEVDMGSIGSAVIELQPPPSPQGIVEDPVNTALRAIEGIVVNDQHGALTQEQKRVAAALNLGAGALVGRGARGNHRLAQLTGRPKTPDLNKAEGAIIGAAVAEARRQAKGDKTPFDDFVRSLTEFSHADAARARREVANQIKDPERRANFLDQTKAVRETQERKDRDDKRADRKGGKGKTGRGNPDY